MKKLYLFLPLNNVFKVDAQVTKIAILDLDNVLENRRFSSFGKAMSSMPITDIEAKTILSQTKTEFSLRSVSRLRLNLNKPTFHPITFLG
jgi:hypothetical protein